MWGSKTETFQFFRNEALPSSYLNLLKNKFQTIIYNIFLDTFNQIMVNLSGLTEQQVNFKFEAKKLQNC